ncbi:MAG: RND family transporter [Xanthomonadales bacterium]|nr:RND family transporter [Xanthomonadales bacterium]
MKRALENLVFGARPVILVLFALVTVVMLWAASQLRVDAGFKKQIPLEHEYMQTFLDYEREFGGANRVLVALMARDGDIFNQEYMAALERLTSDVMALDESDDARVRSLFTPNVRFVEVVEDGFAGGNVIPQSFTPNLEGYVADHGEFETIRGNIVKAGIVGRLVARDFGGTMVWADLIPEDAGTGLDYQALASRLEDLRGVYEDDRHTLHIIGFAKIVGDVSDGAKSVVAFFGIAILITLLLLYVYCRSLTLSALVITCGLVAVVWQLGALRLLGFGIDPMNILTPFLVFAIAVSHGVQMISRWLNQRLDGEDPETAARGTFQRLLVPGIIALASDCIGFVTILFINIRIIQELAITASLGVALIILTNLVLLPVLLSYVRRASRALAGRREGMDGVWRGLSRSTGRGPALAVIVVALALGAGGWWIGQGMQIGDSEAGVPELRPESRYNQDAALIAERFALGIDSIYVIAEAAPDSCTASYPVMETIDRFAWHMANVEGVQQVMSLPQAATMVNAGWNEGNIRWRALPRGSDQLRVATQGFETDSGLLNSDCSAIPVMLFLTDHKATTINRVVEAVKQFRADNDAYREGFREAQAQALADGEAGVGDRINLRLATGNAGVMAATNETVQAAQWPMLMWVYAAVILLCLLTYRSLSATIAIVVPLAVVSMLSNAVMAKLGIGLKVNTLPVAALGVGIGVDYAIYLYSRMQEDLRAGVGMTEAYFRALRTTGAAVLFTAVTLSVGVGTWIFSALKFQADMGILLSFMFLANMLGAILVMPALLRWLRPRAL